MKYAYIEGKTNKLLGWYSDDIHGVPNIPTPNIEVSDEEWQEAISINANCYENGKFIVKDFRTIEPETVVIIPNSVTKLQAKLQLLEIGLLDEVETFIEQDRKAKLYWTDSQNFLRTDEILLSMATALGLNDAQLDDLFLEASKS